MAFSLDNGQRAQRKTLITVAEWANTHYVYTLVTSEPASFDPTQYYKKNSSGQYVVGTTGETWAANTWYSRTQATTSREILGTRTEDSSIEFNADVETTTDIRGITYTDVNKTEPQQDFDPYYLLGGSDLGEYLAAAVLANDIDKYNNVFDVYIIMAIIDEGTSSTHAYKTVKHTGCSIIPTSIGGDSYVSMPIEVHYSNNITSGTVDKLSDDFVFTADV